jgi:hypothetical protein
MGKICFISFEIRANEKVKNNNHYPHLHENTKCVH